MFKKFIVLVLCIFFLNACSMYYVDNKSIKEIIDISISTSNYMANENNKGFRYYLPVDFEVFEDGNYNQILLSKSNKYYMNLDVVSYYFKNNNIVDKESDDIEYYVFEKDDKKGYIKIKNILDKYLIEISYNYAIIEVKVEEEDIKYAVSQSIIILSSVSYNDLVIKKYIGDVNIESSETRFEVPTPSKESDKNILEYMDE